MKNKLPSLVIVGRPNVGKSTLFNRIIGRRVAVVEGTPGITRDRLYAEAEWNQRSFTVIDTGGILFGDEDPLVEQIRIQAKIALTEANVVIFLADCVDGLTAGDIELASQLRAIEKPILVVVNKADNPQHIALANEFYALGIGEVYAISSLHGTGVAEVLDRVVELFPEAPLEVEEQEETKLAIVGRPNVGKSSLLNAFTGEQRAIVSNVPGTTRDAIDTLIEYHDERIRLIDTAGLRRKGKIQGSIEYYMALRATRAVERADCVLILIDGNEGLTDGDKRTAKLAHELGKACVLVVNKWDLIEPPDGCPNRNSPLKKEFLKIIHHELPELSYAPVCFISAKEASGLKAVLETVFTALDSWNMRITTGQLNRIIQDAVYERPYTSKGRNFRIYYASQVSTQPPTIVLFCNNPELLHFSYKRYLENRIRAQFPLKGTSIRLFARSSHNKS
jgi:GTP-binding protein